MIATIVPCVTAAVLFYSPTIRPITPERAQELLRILEIPNRPFLEGNQPGPPEGVPPVRFFRFHANEIRALGMAGPTTIPPLLALFEDPTKHTQVRTQAAAALVRHLAGVFCEVDPRVLGAARAALKDRDPSVRAEVLGSIAVLGKHWNGGNPVLPHPFKTSMSPATLRVIFPDIVSALGDPGLWRILGSI